ncbi:acyl carrier protein [Oscillospiraceae bacterium HV4-5-C5C]|nr:acyl carrier protein [Oscillospiraceae bacterium HV4-5-C5C]
MDEILAILNDVQPGEDYSHLEGLVDKRILDSLSIISLVSELEDQFDIDIAPVDIVPANFNSAAAIWQLVQKLQAEA